MTLSPTKKHLSRKPLYIEDCGIVTALGVGKRDNADALFSGTRKGLKATDALLPGRNVYVGAVAPELAPLPPDSNRFECRNNRLMMLALNEIGAAIKAAVGRYGPSRVAVVLGTSTSGISDVETALRDFRAEGAWPATFDYRQQETGSLARFAAEHFGIRGPAYTVATACSSSAKVFGSARRLMDAGIVDAAIVGGADTLCKMTLGGFDSLGLLSCSPCNPFSRNRDGITIGEGASAFLLSRDKSPVEFLGIGETSDAHHLTAPDPTGDGAREAMIAALRDAHLTPDKIAYVNLHGTGTPLNDAMEAVAVHDVFSHDVASSSTKGMTGHMLGATGGCEAAFLWLSLQKSYSEGRLPPHAWDGERDESFPKLNLVVPGSEAKTSGDRLSMLSNSFGFGGSNVAIIMAEAS